MNQTYFFWFRTNRLIHERLIIHLSGADMYCDKKNQKRMLLVFVITKFSFQKTTIK